MQTRTWGIGLAVAMVTGVAAPAWAQGQWCATDPFGSPWHDKKPECNTSPGYASLGLIRERILNVCEVTTQDNLCDCNAQLSGIQGPLTAGTCDLFTNASGQQVGYCECDVDCQTIDVDVFYPNPASLLPGTQFQPIVFQHGGGVANTFCDKHSADNTFPYSCTSANHYTNPYREIGDQLAFKGSVVMFPIINIGPKSLPWVDGEKINRAVTCLGNRTTTVSGPGGCGEVGEPTCMTNLLNRVAWGTSNKENLVFVGHSAGGIAGMYLPQQLGHALKSIILIDPAKDVYTQNPPVLNGNTPLIHFYPDWYGPLANAANGLFGLMGSTTGTYIPIGVREGTGCNPNNPGLSGCHEAHHCTSLDNTYSWVGGFDAAGHAQFCGPSGNCVAQSLRQPSSPESPSLACPTASTECGRGTACRHSFPGKPANHTWSGGGGGADKFLARYVISYAACTGALYGPEYQSWVNGRDREIDDAGSNTGECRWWDGIFLSTCVNYWTKSQCQADINCKWVQGEDGKAVRINNGQVVTEYVADPSRTYTAAEGYNPTTGQFTERTERLGTTGQYAIRCHAGNGTF